MPLRVCDRPRMSDSAEKLRRACCRTQQYCLPCLRRSCALVCPWHASAHTCARRREAEAEACSHNGLPPRERTARLRQGGRAGCHCPSAGGAVDRDGAKGVGASQKRRADDESAHAAQHDPCMKTAQLALLDCSWKSLAAPHGQDARGGEARERGGGRGRQCGP